MNRSRIRNVFESERIAEVHNKITDEQVKENHIKGCGQNKSGCYEDDNQNPCAHGSYFTGGNRPEFLGGMKAVHETIAVIVDDVDT